MEKLILTAALTGAITVPTQTPHLPYTIEGIANDGIACAKAGATNIHIHARNPENGSPSSDPEIVRQIAARIKEGCDAVICITTGGGMGMIPQDRLRGVSVCQPELGTFNLGTMNFSMHPVARRYKPQDWQFDWEQDYVEGTKDFIFRNTFGDMEVYSSTMKEKNVKPEFEAYDVGHLNNLKFMVPRLKVPSSGWHTETPLNRSWGIIPIPPPVVMHITASQPSLIRAAIWRTISGSEDGLPFSGLRAWI